MPYNAGSAYIGIKPDFRDFQSGIKAEMARQGDQAGKSFGDAFQARVKASFAHLPKAVIRPDVDDAKAKAELDVLTRRRSTTVDVDVNRGALSGLSKLLGAGEGIPTGGMFGAPALLAIVPAIEAAAVEVTALGSGLAAAGAGAGAFALLAKPAFSSVSDAYKKINTDQLAYDRALTKTSRNTALAHLKQDWAALDPAERGAVRGLQGLTTEYRKLSSAFEPQAFKVFNSGLKLAGDLLPEVTPFANTFADAISGLLGRADQAAKSKGFASFLNQLHAIEGPALQAIGDGIAKVVPAVGKLMTVFSAQDDAKAIGIAFNAVAGAVNLTAYAVNRLRTNWDGMSAFAKASVHDTGSALLGLAGIGLGAFKSISDIALTSFKAIVHGAADAFGWVPGLGGKLKAADTALGAFKDSVDGTFAAAISRVGGWKTALDNAPKVAKLQGDISDLTSKLSTAKRELADPHLTAVKRASVQADISQLEAQVDAAKIALASIQNKTVRIDTYVYQHGDAASFNGYAYASGTPAAPPGWAWVGEAGPELVRFRGGEQVLPHAASMAKAQSMASLSSLGVPSIGAAPVLPGVGTPVRSGPLELRVSYAGSGNQLTDALVGALRVDIRDSGGGNVQAHLGRG